MILILAASIMYWSLKKPEEHFHRESAPVTPAESENEKDDTASENASTP